MTLHPTVTLSSLRRRDLGQCLSAGFVNSFHAEDVSSGGGENSRMVEIKTESRGKLRFTLSVPPTFAVAHHAQRVASDTTTQPPLLPSFA